MAPPVVPPVVSPPLVPPPVVSPLVPPVSPPVSPVVPPVSPPVVPPVSPPVVPPVSPPVVPPVSPPVVPPVSPPVLPPVEPDDGGTLGAIRTSLPSPPMRMEVSGVPMMISLPLPPPTESAPEAGLSTWKSDRLVKPVLVALLLLPVSVLVVWTDSSGVV